MKPIILMLLAVILSCLHVHSICAGVAAPYTEEAFERIETAAKRLPPPAINKSDPVDVRACRILEKQREIFADAGYSYDATVMQVAQDTRNPENKIPKDFPTVAGGIVMSLKMLISECERVQADCLRCYPPEVAEAVRSMMKGSRYSP